MFVKSCVKWWWTYNKELKESERFQDEGNNVLPSHLFPRLVSAFKYTFSLTSLTFFFLF